MTSNIFNVLIYNYSTRKVEPYDVIDYFVTAYNRLEEKPEDFEKWVKNESLYQFWSRCQYELVVDSFPSSKQVKIDVHYQIMLNFDLICGVLKKELNI
jgi:hypothetical protein